mgnify:CR=1 FL=1
MTPGMKGNPAAKRVAGLGACGGPGQPPCPPRFQQEVTEAKVQDQKSNRFVKAKVAKKVVASPTPKPPKQDPRKFEINLPKGYEFKSKKEKMNFYAMIQERIAGGKFESQEQLDMAIVKQLKGGEDSPFDPKDPNAPFDPKRNRDLFLRRLLKRGLLWCLLKEMLKARPQLRQNL